ncbi:MAG: LysR family transcriptional regulator [Myxococcales bacterium]|nr:LysR family transcriptional regulator [Myxococcales bacterium]
MKRMKPADAPSLDRLSLLQTFVRIVEAGTLSAAAAQLSTTQPTVSRRLKALEAALGVSLLRRSTQGSRLTEDGARCYAHARQLLEKWAEIEADLGGADETPRGHLRVFAPHAFGQMQLVAPLVAFLKTYPEVTVSWQLNDRLPNFAAEGVDCAIHVGPLDDPGLVVRKLAEVPRIVVAAPALFDPRGPRPKVKTLAERPWVALETFYRNDVTLVHGSSGRRVKLALRPRLVTDSLPALREAVLGGLGVGIASTWAVRDDVSAGRLVHLVPSWSASPLPVYLVLPRVQHRPSRVRAFAAAMREHLPTLAR